jgi:hypothetical protein
VSITAAFISGPNDLWIFVLAVAAWLVIICLNAIARDIERRTELHRLQSQVKAMREQQSRRIEAMGIQSSI